MERTVLQLNKNATKISTVESSVSFKIFIEFLENRITSEQGLRVEFYKSVLKRFEAATIQHDNITAEEIEKYADLFDTVLSVVLPFLEDKDEALIGLGNGLSTDVFYCTNAFYQFLAPYCTVGNKSTFGSKEISMLVHKELQYNFILQRLYGVASIEQKEWVHRIVNPNDGLYKYYRLNIDTRFVDVQVKSTLPQLNPFVIKSHLACEGGLATIEKILPLEHFTATGFTIITLTDITVQQAVEEIGKAVLHLNEKSDENPYENINQLLQALVGSKEYTFGLMPFFTINGRAAILYENFPYSIIVKACWSAGMFKEDLSAFINSFLLNPRLITYHKTIRRADLPEIVQTALVNASISFYALMPVYYNNVLVGLCETATSNDVPLHEAYQLNAIKPALPYISQLLRLSIDKFNNAIEAIIKDKFTSIQPAVQWKFNEVAWHFFRSNEIEHKNAALENIAFKDVYPLYGEVDIRNSTIERNKAQREDLRLQVELLIEIFSMLNTGSADVNIAGILSRCNYWSHHLIHDITIEELQLTDFIKNVVHPILHSLTSIPLPVTGKIASYEASLDQGTEMIFEEKLENSIQLINSALSEYFNEFKEELQSLYPCYFETFRTDGIEYDLYIGQSIAPKVAFSIQYLQKLRLWQVKSMGLIAKKTFSLLPHLQHQLETTQLIFVNPQTIDITFRNDERRFDVEGTYNIRYHVVKKRIDKVHVFNTSQRLTQPGKIAIVYFDEKNAEEYAGYIHQLQQERLLSNDLEYLELEELQGVTGLKALRVGVKMMEDL